MKKVYEVVVYRSNGDIIAKFIEDEAKKFIGYHQKQWLDVSDSLEGSVFIRPMYRVSNISGIDTGKQYCLINRSYSFIKKESKVVTHYVFREEESNDKEEALKELSEVKEKLEGLMKLLDETIVKHCEREEVPIDKYKKAAEEWGKMSKENKNKGKFDHKESIDNWMEKTFLETLPKFEENTNCERDK